jgi:hypothetical protein
MKKSGGTMVLNSGYYHITFKNDIDVSYPIYVKYITDDKISVKYLCPTPFCWYIGYYKWYFKDEFINLIKNITKDE